MNNKLDEFKHNKITVQEFFSSLSKNELENESFKNTLNDCLTDIGNYRAADAFEQSMHGQDVEICEFSLQYQFTKIIDSLPDNITDSYRQEMSNRFQTSLSLGTMCQKMGDCNLLSRLNNLMTLLNNYSNILEVETHIDGSNIRGGVDLKFHHDSLNFIIGSNQTGENIILIRFNEGKINVYPCNGNDYHFSDKESIISIDLNDMSNFDYTGLYNIKDLNKQSSFVETFEDFLSQYDSIEKEVFDNLQRMADGYAEDDEEEEME